MKLPIRFHTARRTGLLAGSGLLALAMTGCLKGGTDSSTISEGAKAMERPAGPGSEKWDVIQDNLNQALAELRSSVERHPRGLPPYTGAADGHTHDHFHSLAKAAEHERFGILMLMKDKSSTCHHSKGFLFMDDEDNVNQNEFVPQYGQSYNNTDGYVGGLQRNNWGENTTFTFCREVVYDLPTARYDYAVVSGGTECPYNSYRFKRVMDNEDDSNVNKQGGTVSPNISSTGGSLKGWSEMYFCFVPGDGSSSTPAMPSIWMESTDFSWTTARNAGYMIFSNGPTADFNNYGKIRSDDEDNNNGNSYHALSSSSSNYLAQMQAIVTPGANTAWHYRSSGSAPATNFDTPGACVPPTMPPCQDGSSRWCSDMWVGYRAAMAAYYACIE